MKQEDLKTHCYINKNEPKFINSMARTMDAFNYQMSTFGGPNTLNKSKHYDEFVAEKRGFLRVTNGYTSLKQNPVRCEMGPNAFLTQYDNKFKDKSVCATDRARNLSINH